MPPAPPATTPNDPRYFDPRDLEAELRRTFQICHECRMCVGYCGSFPDLFARIDRAVDSGAAVGAERLDDSDIKAVADQCWQCKLCYVKCPYTADDQAAELLDFPRLMARERASRARREGIPLIDQLLGEPQVVGQLGGGLAAPLSSFALGNRTLRVIQEKVTGISAEFRLPPMARETFSTWFAKHTPAATAGTSGEVVLFVTCYGEYNTPEVPRAATRVLEHNGYSARVPGTRGDGPTALTCCGLPNIDGGAINEAVEKIKQNVAVLLPHVRQGRKIVVPGPSCGMMIKREWAELVESDDVREVARATVDLMELLAMLGREKKLNREFKRGLGTVAYHAACHLRAQKIGYPGQRVLSVIPDTDVRMVEECSAVDGTWGMKAKFYETGRKYAAKLVRQVADLEPDTIVTDCTLAGLRLAKEIGARPVHPAQALAHAYGLTEDAAS
jgi:glycerol-3-phosphate dehydrogenase subunit C